MTEQNLTFKINDFEGPLDVLLHLIKENKMNIYDIKMVEITQQYLDFLHSMRKLQLDVAGEYLLLAAKLINIKSKMLLPQQSEEIDDEFLEDDPRDELVQQLVMHQVFTNVADEMNDMLSQRQLQYSREQMIAPDDVTYGKLKQEQLPVDLLSNQFAKLIAKKKLVTSRTRRISTNNYTIKNGIIKIRNIFSSKNTSVNFSDIFQDDYELGDMVATFLGLLELTKIGEVTVKQKDLLGDIIITKEKDNAI